MCPPWLVAGGQGVVVMRRAIGILLLTGLLLVLALPGAAAAGGSQPTGAAASAAPLRADFNGDGAADLAIGVPGENNFAGVVQVLYGSSPGGLTGIGSQLWSQNSPGIASAPESGDQFGAVLAAGDFNGDGAADLAIGVPGENDFSGVVHVLYGSSPGGLTGTGSQLWSQNSPGIASAPERDDIFGGALAAGDFNGDAAADLAVGVPGENNFAGVVQVLSGASPGGLTGTGSQLWSQNSPGIASASESGDEFGGALAAGDFNGDGAADLAVGVPGENNFAGVVQVLSGASPGGLTGTGSQLWSQNVAGIADTAETEDLFGFELATGDFNGDAAADLAIGVLGENNFSGVVHVLNGSAPGGLTAVGSQLWSQNSPGIASAPEPGDGFGFDLAAADFNGDAADDLAVGVPGENNFAGVVQVLSGSSPGGLTGTGSQLWSQNSPGIASAPEPGDEFGFALAAADFNGDGVADLAVGVEGENNASGVVQVLPGALPGGLTGTGSQLWSQNSPGIASAPEPGDFFGATLAAGSLSTGGAGAANPAAASPGQGSRTVPQRRS
jgi:hypothetical protein